MKKFQLTDWAAAAEIAGTLGVIVSLMFVVFSVNNNTIEVRASHRNYIYDSSREVELAVASDDEWSRIVVKGRKKGEQLSEIEQYRYDAYLVSTIDIWAVMLERYNDGLMAVSTIDGWDQYFIEWARRNVSESDWQRIKWQYLDDDIITQKIESVISLK